MGCGTIGSLLAGACKSDLSERIELVGLHDIDEKKANLLKEKLNIKTPVLSLEGLIQKSDLVIEAASGGVSAQIVKQAVSAGKDVMVMSTGGLLGETNLFQEAEKRGCRVYIPSGAICGLDGVKAAKAGKISSATLTTRKPPKGLEGVPFIKQKGIDLGSIKKDTLVFEGSASEAVKLFPKNINVSAALSLAGIGADKTNVKIIASPKSNRNTHEIELIGDFGRIYIKCENVPSRENPKTSMLAALSAIATLKGIAESARIGT